MSHNWPISPAVEADATEIASLFAQSWSSPFSRLQFGPVDPLTLSTAMAPRIGQLINSPNVSFMVIRDASTQKVVAVATLPTEQQPVEEETLDEQAEQQAFEDEIFRKSLPEHSNKDLIMHFTIGLRTLRNQLLQGWRHYLLDNLATHPDYRGQGLASKLIEWVFPRAEAEDAVVYLEMASDNPAAGLYRRLGFEEKGKFTIGDISEFVDREGLERCSGGMTGHVHVALIREC
jgi:ribosomal protein S18 acetylase RimI-like enzyme